MALNILFINSLWYGNVDIDYLNDSILHGLLKLGHNVVDVPYNYKMSKTFDDKEELRFSTIKVFDPNRENIYRGNIEERIKEKEFDIIIYGSCRRNLNYFDIVTQHYDKNKIILLDGEDNSDIWYDVIDKGIYFKRELNIINNKVLPIQFSMIDEQINLGYYKKERFESFITPLNKETYIYTNKDDYYRDYQKSYFGYTCIKGGVDCMRHYEIIGNRCLPYFPQFNELHRNTMFKWSNDLQLECNYLHDNFNEYKYNLLLNDFYNYYRDNLTSDKMANYMLNKI